MPSKTPRDDVPGGKARRRRPIRLRITALLLVPLVSLIALWAFAANITLGDAFDKYDFSTTYEKMGLPGLYLVNQLQAERSSASSHWPRTTPGPRRSSPGSAPASAPSRSRSGRPRCRPTRRTRRNRRRSSASRRRSRPRQAAAAARQGRLRPGRPAGRHQLLQHDARPGHQGVRRPGVGQRRRDPHPGPRADRHRQRPRLHAPRGLLVTAAMARNGRLTPDEHTAFVQWAAEGGACSRPGSPT